MVFTNEEAAMIEGVLSTYFMGANTAENVRSAYSCVWQHLAADALDADPMQLILQLRITSVKPAIGRVSAS